MPNLTENFDQLKMSSEIRSSDHSPKISLKQVSILFKSSILLSASGRGIFNVIQFPVSCDRKQSKL
jgi:hypothetical protein